MLVAIDRFVHVLFNCVVANDRFVHVWLYWLVANDRFVHTWWSMSDWFLMMLVSYSWCLYVIDCILGANVRFVHQWFDYLGANVRFVISVLVSVGANVRFVHPCIFVLPLFLMHWRTSWSVLVRELAIHRAMRWWSAHASQGDPRPYEEPIPDCMTSSVYLLFAFVV